MNHRLLYVARGVRKKSNENNKTIKDLGSGHFRFLGWSLFVLQNMATPTPTPLKVYAPAGSSHSPCSPNTVPPRSLVTGGAASSIHTFFTKLRSLQTKHSFSLVLALDLFSDIPDDSLDLAELIAGKIDVPVQVYVAIGGGKLPNKIVEKLKHGEEVCKNVMVLGQWLGGRGTDESQG